MAPVNERPTETQRHCAYCGQPVTDGTPGVERFGEPFCSDPHAEEFVSEVRAARVQAAARAEASANACALAPAGQRTWKSYLKQGACWGAPLLLLLAIPLFWSGNAAAATGGSILSLLALLACPLGMFFMMRAMGNMGGGRQPGAKKEPDSHDPHRR